ncbi:prorelaxin-like [Ochotona princeps]|uniref:prorelaxin-like n=1 Tax=Ochotona princeps TaxID=9978 RepID=UPI0027145766|nr:prorelaxin-like [Ochotona princeps]
MPSLLLFYLLGIWLPQGHLCRSARGDDAWLDHVIKACGRELSRNYIEVCGMTYFRRERQRQAGAFLSLEPATETVPSSIEKDTENVTMILEDSPNLSEELKAPLSAKQPSSVLSEQHTPTLMNLSLSLEEWKKMAPNDQAQVEDNSPSELKSLGLSTQRRRKRDIGKRPSDQCCNFGCTRRFIAELC